MPKRLIPMAIAYDFDGTLAPGNMQEYDFIPKLNMKSREFWKQVNDIAVRHDADQILAYMFSMLDKAEKLDVKIQRSDFREYGERIEFFPGVLDWFDRVNGYAKLKGVRLEHFLISSGIREMIEGTAIYKKFKKVYASGFMFDQHDVAEWLALAINYTTKTQYLFRINKGSLDVHDNSIINKYVPMEDRPVPFENIVFIGDGETDIPCMRLVKDQGGHSIAVYGARRNAKQHALQLIKEGRANFVAPANYSAGSDLEGAVFAIIYRVEATARIK
jgi:phosphoserine phosphatase